MEYGFSSLQDKTVLVTGGSGSIGLAIARGFVYTGAKVVLWGHRVIPSEIIDEFADYQVVELMDVEGIGRAYQGLSEKHGTVDVLVNCAGYTKSGVGETYRYEDWRKTIDINLTAPFVLSKHVATGLIAAGRSGNITHITSIGAELGFPENPAYVSSKGGLRQLAKGQACDWACYGIRVNSIGPGYTQTKMTHEGYSDPEKRQQRAGRTLLNEWAQPEDIVGMVLFLASDMARYITGQSIYIDGGWTAKGI